MSPRGETKGECPLTKSAESSESNLQRRRRSAQTKDAAGYAERRHRIIASAAAAFSEVGYDATTFADIARRAGADRASVYYYASSKEELFQLVCSGMLESNLEAAENIAARDITADKKLSLILHQHMATHAAGFPQWTVLVQEMRRITDADTTWSKDAVTNMRRYESVVREIVETGMQDGTLRSDLPADLVVHSLFGMLNWTHRWYKPDGRYNAEQIADAFAGVALGGLMVSRDSPSDGTS